MNLTFAPSPRSSAVPGSHFPGGDDSTKRSCSLWPTSENPADANPSITDTIQLVSGWFQYPWPKGRTETYLIFKTKAPVNSSLPSEAASFPEEVRLVYIRVHCPLPQPLLPGTLVSSLLFFPLSRQEGPLQKAKKSSL